MSKAFRWISLLIIGFVIFFPLYIALATSLKTESELGHSLIYALPRDLFNFSNYIKVFKVGNFGVAFYNIIFIIVLSNLGNVIVATMAAFVMGRFKYKVLTVIYGAYAVAMIIPGITTQVATYGLIHALGLLNTRWSMIVMNLGTSFVQLTLYLTFVRSVPYELDESAIVDGASLFRVYWSIILPLLKPAIATNVILMTIGIYNDIYSPFLYMPSSRLAVVSTVLTRFSSGISTNWTQLSAAVIICAIPTILLYLALQKFILAGIAGGAVKG